MTRTIAGEKAENGELLRPAFTRELAERLLQGASINLTAAHGFGRRQTLRDLRLLLPAEMRVLYIDMKFCAADCLAALADLGSQAGCDMPHVRHLGQIIEALSKSPGPALLILHNVDLLREGEHDPLFDSALLPYLESFSDHMQLSLLTVCEDTYADWPLPCEHLPLPPRSLHSGP